MGTAQAALPQSPSARRVLRAKSKAHITSVPFSTCPAGAGGTRLSQAGSTWLRDKERAPEGKAPTSGSLKRSLCVRICMEQGSEKHANTWHSKRVDASWHVHKSLRSSQWHRLLTVSSDAASPRWRTRPGFRFALRHLRARAFGLSAHPNCRQRMPYFEIFRFDSLHPIRFAGRGLWQRHERPGRHKKCPRFDRATL